MLVLPTPEYHKRVPVSIHTSVIDVVTTSLHASDFEHAQQSRKAVYCTTQIRRQVQSQQLQKGIVKTTKPVTLQPFSPTSVYCFTKIKGHGMRLNLIAVPISDSQLCNSIQCIPTCCILEPGSSGITIGLRNVSAKKITIQAKVVICQMHLANMVAKLYASVGQVSREANKEEDGSWIIER